MTDGDTDKGLFVLFCSQSISSHFASVGCQYIDVTGTVQEAAERELIDTYVKRGNLPAKVTDEDGKERNIMMKVDTRQRRDAHQGLRVWLIYNPFSAKHDYIHS